MEQWLLITALLPNGYELIPHGDYADISYEDKSVRVIKSDDNTYVIEGKVINFADNSEEIINTLLVPYILQELDGEKRL